MKVLWFSVTPIKPSSNGGASGLGWIGSLMRVIAKQPDVQLGIAYYDPTANISTEEMVDGISFFSIGYRIPFITKKLRCISFEYDDKMTLKCSLDIVNKFRPDVIQVFGSEWCFGLLSNKVHVPVIIHMQGSLISYYHTTFPSGFNYEQTLGGGRFNVRMWIKAHNTNITCRKRVQREEEVLRNTSYFFGRTHWDYALTRLYSPNSKYYYCSEALRDSFVNADRRWSYAEKEISVISTVSNSAGIKGYDVILRCAKVLCNNRPSLRFKWNLYGITPSQLKIYERLVGICAKDVCVEAKGLTGALELQEVLLKSDLFVHTSYMDNSPNAICEAQYLGLPIVTTAPGGVPDLFDARYPKEYLLPIDDPHFMAYEVQNALSDSAVLMQMSDLNYEVSHARHSDANILKDLLSAYREVIEDFAEK